MKSGSTGKRVSITIQNTNSNIHFVIRFFVTKMLVRLGLQFRQSSRSGKNGRNGQETLQKINQKKTLLLSLKTTGLSNEKFQSPIKYSQKRYFLDLHSEQNDPTALRS